MGHPPGVMGTQSSEVHRRRPVEVARKQLRKAVHQLGKSWKNSSNRKANYKIKWRERTWQFQGMGGINYGEEETPWRNT